MRAPVSSEEVIATKKDAIASRQLLAILYERVGRMLWGSWEEGTVARCEWKQGDVGTKEDQSFA